MPFRGYSSGLIKQIMDAHAADPDHIGVQLGLACINGNVPVHQVAEELGVARISVYKWFTGKFYPAKLEHRNRMAAMIAQLS